jgi:crotonobetainyl-CoA:carnitine CoA-transferase CaiB-like acyl-CoA transferase
MDFAQDPTTDLGAPPSSGLGHPGALAGLRVLEVASLYAAPLVGTNFADFGADVIKVEHPAGDDSRRWGASKDGVPLWWKALSRGKHLLTLDLHEPTDRKVVRELVTQADVLIENFRPGRMSAWGLGYETLAELNPRLVMVSVTGFGQSGPLSGEPGFGTLAEAFSGFAALTGPADGPPTLPAFGLADGVAGSIATFATLAALYWRDARGGKGQHVDVSLYEPLFSILGPQVIEYTQAGIVQERRGNRSPRTSPRNTYRTSDGRWVALSGGTQQVVNRMFGAMGDEVFQAERFSTPEGRRENADELDQLVAGWMERHTQADVLRRFQERQAPVAPVMDVTQIVQHPQYLERESVVEVDDPDLGAVLMQNVVPRLSATPGKINFTGLLTSDLSPQDALDRWAAPNEREQQ